jgi:serine/threonine protein kinase/tetratricopeptide (TPR) repeat protein
LAPGATVDRYQVLGAVGRGGMGEVYAAYHPDLDRRIALKVVAAFGSGGTERAVRLLREARAIARLSHPNVVNVYDAGVVADGIYIAMEFIEGETIDAWCRRAPRTWREILHVFIAAGRGLAAAHAAGIVHRDFKPQNVMVGRDGSVRVTDFGLARLAGETAGEQDRRPGDPRQTAETPISLTKAGAVLGTPAYMAPEQFEGAAGVDARADQFSFCVALHEALYGVRPVLAQLRSPSSGEAARDSASVGSPGRLRSVVNRGLAHSRTQRYPSMNELLGALERSRTVIRPRALAVAAGVAATLLLLGGWRLGHHGGVSCAAPADRLAAVWSGHDDARRQSLHRMFMASGRASAETSWRAFSTALDEHLGRWSAMYVDSCEATHLRGEQSTEVLDLRTSCLTESLDEVRALTDALTAPDSGAVANASMAARNLTPLNRCADLELLRSAVPLPRNPETLKAVQRLRAELRTARAQGDLGRDRAAGKAAEALRPAVEALGDKALLAELLELIGSGLAIPKPGEAEPILEQALLVAEGSGDRETAAKAASALAFVIGRQLGRGAEGERWARIADAMLNGLRGNHDRLRGWVANDLGSVLSFEGKCDKARSSFERAVSLKAKALGYFRDAVVTSDKAIEIIEKNGDPSTYTATAARVNRGHALVRLGRHPEAEDDFKHGLISFQAAGPDAHPRHVAEPLHGLGEVYLAKGHVAEAISYLERALRIRQTVELDTVLVAHTHFALARALEAAGRDRRRARALANAAREAYASKRRPEEREVAAWLAAQRYGGRSHRLEIAGRM